MCKLKKLNAEVRRYRERLPLYPSPLREKVAEGRMRGKV
jgi:hypothetical protein